MRYKNTFRWKIVCLNEVFKFSLRHFVTGCIFCVLIFNIKKIRFIFGFSYNSFLNVVQVLPSFSDWLRRLDPSLSNSVVAYKRDFFQNMTSENSREALGARNAFSYVEAGRLEGSNPKAIMKFLIQACDYK